MSLILKKINGKYSIGLFTPQHFIAVTNGTVKCYNLSCLSYNSSITILLRKKHFLNIKVFLTCKQTKCVSGRTKIISSVHYKTKLHKKINRRNKQN